MKYPAIFVLAGLFFNIQPTQAQKAKAGHVLTADEAKVVKKDANTLFSSGDYKAALKSYQDLHKASPDNVEYNYRLGVCYVMTSVNKSAAAKFMEAGASAKDMKKDGLFFTGLAYMYANRYTEAEKAFEEYKNIAGNKPFKEFPTPERMMEMCRNGKELLSKPVAVTFSNPGKFINSPYEDYNPYVSADGKTLVFTSRRKGNIGGFIEDLGIYTADIYWTQWKDTIWTKAKGLGGIVNGEWDEEVVSINAAGDQIIVYFDNVEYFADLGYSQNKGRSWQKPVMFSERINSKQFEGGACISLDGSKLIFSSGRKDGPGGSDLWMSTAEADGSWGVPVLLGPEINTKYDEDEPFLSMDGKNLYFCSKGHNSMGGFDIFRSEWNDQESKWNPAVNLGYPINNSEDNTTISITGDGRTAWISAVRAEGIGETDIWKLDFQDPLVHPFRTLITGSVASDAGTRISLQKVILEDANNKKIMEFKPSALPNYFVLSAAAGEYVLRLEGAGFSPYSRQITVCEPEAGKNLQLEIIVQSSK